jgi:hypothetical protein
MCIWEFFICRGNISVGFVVRLCSRPYSVRVCVRVCVCVRAHVSGVFVVMSLRIPPFWDVMPHCWTRGFRHFVGTFCVYPEESSGLL